MSSQVLWVCRSQKRRSERFLVPELSLHISERGTQGLLCRTCWLVGFLGRISEWVSSFLWWGPHMSVKGKGKTSLWSIILGNNLPISTRAEGVGIHPSGRKEVGVWFEAVVMILEEVSQPFCMICPKMFESLGPCSLIKSRSYIPGYGNLEGAKSWEYYQWQRLSST